MSYSDFKYEWVKQPVVLKDSISFSIKVKNVGKYDGDELIQAYIHYPELPNMPGKELKAFKRLFVKTKENGIDAFSIPLGELKKWDMARHEWTLYPGDYQIVLGNNSNDEKLSSVVSLEKKSKK